MATPSDIQADFQQAVAFYREGRIAEAETLCSRVLAAAPAHFDARHLLGVLALQAKSYARAADLLNAALDINPGSALAHNNYGMAVLEQGRTAQALAAFDKAVTLRPDMAAALNNRGNALRLLGRAVEALAAFDNVVAVKPDYAEAWYNRGLALYDLGRLEEAAVSYTRAIALNPVYAEAFNAWGLALRDMGDVSAALEHYDRAVALKPQLADAWNNRAVALQDVKRYDEALANYDRALALAPEAARTWSNRGTVLDYLCRYDEALRSYDEAVTRDPAFANGWNNRGVALGDMGRHSEALESFQRAIAAEPGNADAHWNSSLHYLQQGDFARGWAEHEWRWKVPSLALEHRNFEKPLWLGELSLAGRTILLHGDQGFGDAIQFCRYAGPARDAGARVIVEVRAPLAPLLASLPGADHIVVRGEALPPFDLHCPMGSLPVAFNTTLDTIPVPGGYLSAPPDKRAAWSTKLGPAPLPRVGIAWRGNPAHKNDHNRSIALAQLMTALPPGFEFIALQKDMTAEEHAMAAAAGLRCFPAEMSDFTDTAALCGLVDLVISVDTSTAHLAGALGIPVWILLPFNPDWRWMLKRSDSPWYASARLYRKPRPNDWPAVCGVVRTDLERLSSA